MILELLISGALQKHPTAPQALVNIKPTIQTVEQLKPMEQIEAPEYEIEETAALIPVPAETPGTTHAGASQSAAQPSSGGLTGSIGRVLHYGNCVNELGINKGIGNPINWPALTRTPSIGATALWTYNHTGYIVGIWDNGDLEVRHQNYSGNRTRFSINEFRGFR